MADPLRTSIRFTDEEAQLAARLRQPDSAESAAVRALTGRENLAHAPASMLMHILAEAGMQAIRAKAEDIRYERLAEHLETDEEHQAWRSSRRRRSTRRLTEAA